MLFLINRLFLELSLCHQSACLEPKSTESIKQNGFVKSVRSPAQLTLRRDPFFINPSKAVLIKKGSRRNVSAGDQPFRHCTSFP
jgi:hypothetical protein